MLRTVGEEWEETHVIEVERIGKIKKGYTVSSLNASERASTIRTNKHPLQMRGPYPQLKGLIPREGSG